MILMVQLGEAPHEAIMRSLRRFAEEVMPEFKQAPLAANAASSQR